MLYELINESFIRADYIPSVSKQMYSKLENDFGYLKDDVGDKIITPYYSNGVVIHDGRKIYGIYDHQISSSHNYLSPIYQDQNNKRYINDGINSFRKQLDQEDQKTLQIYN